MKFEFSPHPLHKISADVLLVFALQHDDKKKTGFIALPAFQELDNATGGLLTKICALEQFSGKRKETITVYPEQALASKIIILGLGKKDEFVADDLRRSMGALAKRLHYSVDSLVVSFPEDTILGLDRGLTVQMVTEGLLLGSYEFGKYKQQEKKDHVLDTVIISEPDKKVQKTIKAALVKGELYANATRVARDLINEQPYVATPTHLADFAKSIAKSSPSITCKVFDKAQAEKLGMEAFLGIARASDTPPKFIHLTYTPASQKSKRKLAIVGKGITFDSGGINVKPGDYMQEMKMDMSGAAAVLGIFSVIAEIKPDFTVMGLIAATPNMISGKSIVPGDVVRAMNGKTIEILNTDAEGRVTMADSISYAVKEGATEIIDFATLTGACVVALGDDIAGLFPNNQDLAAKIKAAAFDAGEKVWEMPMEKEYKSQNKSEVADIANVAHTRYGGAITAGLFLAEFAGDTPFVHVDIAGPAFTSKGSDISPKGGTGFGVRTVLNLVTEKEAT